MYIIQVKTDAGWVTPWRWKDLVFWEKSNALKLISCIDEKWRDYYRVQDV